MCQYYGVRYPETSLHQHFRKVHLLPAIVTEKCVKGLVLLNEIAIRLTLKEKALYLLSEAFSERITPEDKRIIHSKL